MTTVLIVIHLMVVVAMIGLVLLQRSEGGALGIGGGGGSGAFMTGRGAANMLTRSTAGLAVAFFATSILLTLFSRWESGPVDIFQSLPDQPAAATEEAPAPPITGAAGARRRCCASLEAPRRRRRPMMPRATRRRAPTHRLHRRRASSHTQPPNGAGVIERGVF